MRKWDEDGQPEAEAIELGEFLIKVSVIHALSVIHRLSVHFLSFTAKQVAVDHMLPETLA
jgi:hypothetical protein